MVISLRTFVDHRMSIKEDHWYSREKSYPVLILTLTQGCLFIKQQRSGGRRLGHAWQLGYLVGLSSFASACPRTQERTMEYPRALSSYFKN